MEPTADLHIAAELLSHLRSLARQKWLVLGITFGVVFLGTAITLRQTKTYTAQAQVLIDVNSQQSLFVSGVNSQAANPQRVVLTEIEVIKSTPVEDIVRKQLGPVPKVHVSGGGTTDTVFVSVSSPSPAQATAAANAYADAYIRYRRTQRVNEGLASGAQIQQKINDLQSSIVGLNAQIAAESPSQQASANDALVVQRNSVLQQQASFSQRLQQLEVDAASLSTKADIVNPATLPSAPSSPKPVRSGILAGVLGLVLGIGAALFRDQTQDVIRTSEDVNRVSPSSRVISIIPVVPNWRNRSETHLISIEAPHSAVSEAFRSLRTAVQFLALDETLSVLEITSAVAGEGKSTVVANLAVALARAGSAVVAVDCDLRRPRMHQFFGTDNSVGFTSVLLGDTPLSVALHPVPDVPGLRVLPSGPIPTNPSELLTSPRTEGIVTALRGVADIVLIDSPPVLPVSDATIMSARADGCLVVASAERTTRRLLRQALETLGQVEAPVLGVVLNRVPSGRGSAYGSGYYADGGYGGYYRRGRSSAENGGYGARVRSGSQVDAPAKAAN